MLFHSKRFKGDWRTRTWWKHLRIREIRSYFAIDRILKKSVVSWVPFHQTVWNEMLWFIFVLKTERILYLLKSKVRKKMSSSDLSLMWPKRKQQKARSKLYIIKRFIGVHACSGMTAISGGQIFSQWWLIDLNISN